MYFAFVPWRGIMQDARIKKKYAQKYESYSDTFNVILRLKNDKFQNL